jgi:transposase
MSIELRKDIPSKELYKRAKKETNPKIRSRMLGIAALLDGHTRTHACLLAGISNCNLIIWMKRFNEEGIEGLRGKKMRGKKSNWTAEIENFLKEKALEGASFEKDKRVTYRLKDFQAMILEKFGVKYGISTIWYALKRLGLSWVSVRPKHPKTDPVAQEKKTPNTISEIQSRYPDKKIEVWFQDEARIGQHGTLTRRWAQTGTRPRALRDFRFESAYIFGAICPSSRKASAIVFSQVGSEEMNHLLEEI